ncbi:hAT transposon superfamily [Euphorbia peplus]|nr:hAT transposon superfamily [Euphorbia peplus]
MAICRWLYDACIPFNATNSTYFQPAIDAIATISLGFKGPSYNDVRVNFLSDCKKECALLIDSYRSNWKVTGCTLMADVDASDVVKDAATLCYLFSEAIEWVGSSNIVHVVTDNAANYVAVGRLIHEKYANIYWSPCAAHCINLILKDIGSMSYVANLSSRASKITVFVYNHIIFLSWLRKRDGWKEIVRPTATRFATTFITLQSVLQHKLDLQALVTNRLFTSHKLSKTINGKTVSSTVLDKKFWDDCEIVVQIAGPLIRLLRIVDSDERPSLPYIYDGIRRARKVIKHLFRKKVSCYNPYIKIIDERWDKHLKKSLHGATYFLNPAFLYGDNFCEKPEIMCGFFIYLRINL